MPDRYCPQCGAKVSERASFCPACGGPVAAAPYETPAQQNQFSTPPTEQRPPGWWKRRPLWLVIGAVVVVLIVAVTAAAFAGDSKEQITTTTESADATSTTEASDETTTTEPSETTTTEPAVEATGSDTYAMGETAEMDGLQITVNSAHWDEGNDFSEPDAGTRWLVIDATLKNTGSESEIISSLMMFKLIDEESYERDMELFADTKGSLDGELAAGSTMRGQIAYDVDEGQERWWFTFEPNVFGTGQLTYEITSAEFD